MQNINGKVFHYRKRSNLITTQTETNDNDKISADLWLVILVESHLFKRFTQGIHKILGLCSYLLKKSLTVNLIFSAVKSVFTKTADRWILGIFSIYSSYILLINKRTTFNKLI